MALPLLTFALAGVSGEQVPTPHAAQARLAEALADADSVDWVRADGNTVTFAIDHAGEAYRIVATTRGHRIVSLEIIDAGRAAPERGAMSWLVGEMRDVTAIRDLAVDANGAITLETTDGRHYAVEPMRGANAAVEARWAAEWDSA